MSLLRNINKLSSIFTRNRYVINLCVRKNMSALVQQYDDEFDYYYYYDNNKSITLDTYPSCWYCKGTRYVKCTFCEEGCPHCSYSQMVPCPFCNHKKPEKDFILLKDLN